MNPDYQFLDNCFYYALNEEEGFTINIPTICLLKNKKIIKEWNIYHDLPGNFPKDWFENLWKDLAKTCFEGRADQWSSEYYSILGDRIIYWCDDRKENSNFIYGIYLIEKLLDDTSLPPALQKWLKGNFRHMNSKTPPGPPEHSN